jgi:hypothetical protein
VLPDEVKVENCVKPTPRSPGGWPTVPATSSLYAEAIASSGSRAPLPFESMPGKTSVTAPPPGVRSSGAASFASGADVPI